MSKELPLGQRVIDVADRFTADEIDLIKRSGSLPREVEEYLRIAGPQTLNAALNGINELRSGGGRGRRQQPMMQTEADDTRSPELGREIDETAQVDLNRNAEAAASMGSPAPKARSEAEAQKEMDKHYGSAHKDREDRKEREKKEKASQK